MFMKEMKEILDSKIELKPRMKSSHTLVRKMSLRWNQLSIEIPIEILA